MKCSLQANIGTFNTISTACVKSDKFRAFSTIVAKTIIYNITFSKSFVMRVVCKAILSSDWFTGLSGSVVIGQSYYVTSLVLVLQYSIETTL